MGTLDTAVVEQQSEWVVAHAALSRLAQARASADAEEGRWLLAALRSAAHVHLGFGSFGEYAERILGYKPRTTQERLRVAEALEQLPGMAQALEQGNLHWSAVRELTRVAVAENEQEWIELARGKSVRQLEELVAGKCPGDDPSSPHTPDARRHVLRFEVAPETFALFREALTALRRSTDCALDDDAALLAMARHVLGGPRDESRASYQIVLSVCPECGRGQQSASGEFVPVGPEIVAMAQCDGQHIGRIASHSDDENAHIGGALANDNAHADAHAHVDANAHAGRDQLGAYANDNARVNANARVEAHAHLDAHAHAGRDQLGAHANDNALVNANARVDAHAHVDVDAHPGGDQLSAHVGANVAPGAHVESPALRTHVDANASSVATTRATQTIPPARRRAVLLRDHRRCRVPGCRNSRFLDLHHLELRSEGGPHQPDNLLTVCSVHHRAAHRGQLLIERGPTGVRFCHADGRAYGHAVEPRALDAHAKTFSALRNLGFREAEVRAVLAQLRGESDLRDATTEQLLRAALACLTPPRTRP